MGGKTYIFVVNRLSCVVGLLILVIQVREPVQISQDAKTGNRRTTQISVMLTLKIILLPLILHLDSLSTLIIKKEVPTVWVLRGLMERMIFQICIRAIYYLKSQ